MSGGLLLGEGDSLVSLAYQPASGERSARLRFTWKQMAVSGAEIDQEVPVDMIRCLKIGDRETSSMSHSAVTSEAMLRVGPYLVGWLGFLDDPVPEYYVELSQPNVLCLRYVLRDTDSIEAIDQMLVAAGLPVIRSQLAA
jgi:hypothetical protein